MQRQPAGQGQQSLQHLLHSSGGSTPSGRQGSSSINDLQPNVSGSLPPRHSSEAAIARAQRPAHRSNQQQNIGPPDLPTGTDDPQPVGSWLDDDDYWHQRMQGTGAHGSHAANDPLLHMFPSQAPDATGCLPSSLSRPFSILPLPLPDVPFGEEMLDLHPSLSSPVIRLPGSDEPDMDANLPGSWSMMQLDILHDLPAPATHGGEGFAGPPAAVRGQQGRRARAQRRTTAPGQGLTRAISAPVLRRSTAAHRHQLHLQHHLQSEGFDFSIECALCMLQSLRTDRSLVA